MLILTGNNLGERHRELNTKVAEAAAKETNFDEVKSEDETSDVDKLFKIDLASRYRNVEYILETLRCGDAFHITRALKCSWLYSDECSKYINTSYLKTNVFPYMSNKMQRKMLTTIYLELKDGCNRAIEFYEYCKNAKLKHYAYKFLVLTPEHYKIMLMKNKSKLDYKTSPEFLQQFIGNSIALANAFIQFHGSSQHVIHILRYLYSVSDEWYLDILQRYENNDTRYPANSQRLGLRISKDIIRRHKNRIIKFPVLYMNKLNKNMIIKYLTREDVESLTFNLLPNSVSNFWSINFYNTYKFILDKIFVHEKFTFLKNIYNSKYGGQSFELRIEFYKLEYYELLSIDERETWALGFIERDEDIPGVQSYIWYKFVSFKKAFSGIKRFIFLTPDEDIRSQIVNILPETCRDQEDVRAMLNYYYQRHVNENESNKESFINKIFVHQDLYSFDNDCWESLDKLFYSLEVYSSYAREEYKARSLIYHTLHDIELPEALTNYIDYANWYNITSIIDELSPERNEVVSKFLMNFYVDKLIPLLEKVDNVSVKDDDEFACNTIENQIDDYIRKIWNVIYCFKRDHKDCPEIVLEYMEKRKENYQYHVLYKPKFIPKTEGDFGRWLKQDLVTAIDGIYEIRHNTYRWRFRLSRLFRKLKVYFSDDVGKEYLKYFVEYLSDIPKGYREYRNIKMAVVGVFYLANDDYKLTFMKKHIPETPKIDHKNIDNRLLQVQKAICRLAYHSRPALPLAAIHKYITGDYVHYVLPIFNNYVENLPSVNEFIEAVLNSPLSIQKHGLRLAFKSYRPEILKPIIVDAWNRTKNVSLRKLLYGKLFDRIVNETSEAQKELYEVLISYTTQLNHDDHDDIYSLLVSDALPDEFKGNYIETSWFTVNQLSDKTCDIYRRKSIICHMEKYIHLVNRDFPRLQIIDDYLKKIFCARNFKHYSQSDFEDLAEDKCNLTARYIVSFKNKEQQIQSLELLRHILKKCIALWDHVYEDTYTSRKFIRDFISLIMNKEPKDSKRCAEMVPFYRCMVNEFKKALNEEEMYLLMWELKLLITGRKIVDNGRNKCNDNQMSSKEIIESYGKAVGLMVQNLVESNYFYHSFYESIADIVKRVGDRVCDIIDSNDIGVIYYVSDTLTDIKMNETYTLALLMLPRDPDEYWKEEHISIIEKIKLYDNKQIRCYFHNKYVVSDFKVREGV